MAFYVKINGYLDYSSDDHFRKIMEDWSKERDRVKDSRVSISPGLLESIGKLSVEMIRKSLYSGWCPS